jgi:hypothetical protein
MREGGSPLALLKDGPSALPIICLRATLVMATTVRLGGATGVSGRLLKIQPSICSAVAFRLAIVVAVCGCLVDFAVPGYQGSIISVWLPMVALAPRIARKIVAPQIGFW